MAVLLALALHGLVVVGLLSTPSEPMQGDIVMDVVLTPPPRPKAAFPDEPKASRPPIGEQASRAPSTPATPRAQVASRISRDGEDWKVREAATPEKEGVRQSLRAGVGCQSADFLSLTKAEREACEAKLAAGAKDAPVYAVVSPRLKKQFDGVFECPKDDAWCEYRIGKGPYPGLFAPRRKKRTDWD